MDWPEALETVVGRTRHERYRALCADDHPDHAIWRAKVVAKATGMPAPSYPSLAVQAGNAAKALGRVVAAVVQGERIKVEPAVYCERLAICLGCEFNGARPAGVRCTKCGCGSRKLEFATEECPVGKW